MSDRYYQILGVSSGASAAELKAAFRRLAHRYHPDISSEANAKEKFIEVVDAYRALTSGNGIKPPPFDQEPERKSYKKSERPKESKTPKKGKDCTMDVPISIEELYWGIEVKVDPVSGCHGRRSEKNWRNSSLLKVKIKRGTRNGEHLRLRGKGEPGTDGGANGDLVLTIKIKPHDRYDVSGDNIYVDMPLSRWEAKEGAIVDLITPGGRIEVDVPAGIASGQSIRIPRRGLPHSSSSADSKVEMGDMFAVARLVDVDKRTEATHKWPHISHDGAVRWQTVGKTHGSNIDIRV